MTERTYKLIAVFLLALTVVFGITGVLTAQNGQRLYLVTGMRTPTLEVQVPSSVLLVDESRHSVVPVATLVDASQGSSFIVTDHERRLVVIGTPNNRPGAVVVLSMDSPRAPRSIPITVGVGTPEAFLLDSTGGETILSIRTSSQGKDILSGVSATSADARQRELPWESYRGVRREGLWSPGDEPGGRFVITIKDGKLVSNRGGGPVELNIPAPGNLGNDAEQLFQLDISNDRIFVLDHTNERGKGTTGAAGNTVLSILNKKTNTWSKLTFPGGGSSVRGFGQWVVVKEADIRVDLSKNVVVGVDNQRESPGKAFRQGILNPQAPTQEQISADSPFVTSPLFFSGAIHFYDADTQRRYRLDTGQGDTEVLLIEGATVYYRINDVLYRAQLSNGTVTNAIEILKDGAVPTAHWAFLGP